MYAQDNNSLPVWIILSPAHHHISINSQPFLVGIVSKRDVELPEIEQILEDKYQAMKHFKGWDEVKDDYALFTSQSNMKKPKKAFKGHCGYCGEFGH